MLTAGTRRWVLIGSVGIAVLACSFGIASPRNGSSRGGVSAIGVAATGAAGLRVNRCVAVDSGIERLDSTKVVTPQACAKCHVQEAKVWERTPHFRTFEQLQRNPRAREIADRMGIRSIKRNDVCANCHYTRVETNGRERAVAGVSCESCHGAGRDWVTVHNDFGGPAASREGESAQHRNARRRRSVELGMRNPSNIYRVARSCLACHTVPHESLVNQGGHVAGSADFELVAWSQGSVRHRFRSTNGSYNAPNDLERLRLMFIAGLIADLEFSTRATAIATTSGRYGTESATRAANAAVQLRSIYEQVSDTRLRQVLIAFAKAELRTNNSLQLREIADEIQQAGIEFADSADGSEFACVDSLLPSDSEYR